MSYRLNAGTHFPEIALPYSVAVPFASRQKLRVAIAFSSSIVGTDDLSAVGSWPACKATLRISRT